jgi:UDP-3-O-[3-hydroxymyristoyl] N-acetylglucosamine deacetylase
MTYQKTLKIKSEMLTGVGVHTGKHCSIQLFPAKENAGIQFVRTDIDPNVRFIPCYSTVKHSRMNTTLQSTHNNSVIELLTVEHILSALNGLGITNALIDICGPEVPVIDGSALPFTDIIINAGIEIQNKKQKYLQLLTNVRITNENGGYVELSPSDVSTFDVKIAFDEPVGKQNYTYVLDDATYINEIAIARTFGFIKDYNQLKNAGLALGASFSNTIVIGEDEVISNLRCPDEFVRHKILDAIGDMSLSDYPIVCKYKSYMGGHQMTVAAIKKLYQNKNNYRIIA